MTLSARNKYRLRYYIQVIDNLNKTSREMKYNIEALHRRGFCPANEMEEFRSEMEKELVRLYRYVYNRIKDEIQEYDIFLVWLDKILGVGPITAARLVCYIEPIGRFDNVSKLWAYAGLTVVNGCSHTKNNPVYPNHCRGLRQICWQIGDMMSKRKSPYYNVYLSYKTYLYERTKVKNEPAKAGHIHAMAMKYVSKVFLSHVWEVWREIEGFPPSGNKYIKWSNPWKYVKAEKQIVTK